MKLPQNEQEFELVILEYLISKRKKEIRCLNEKEPLRLHDENDMKYLPIYENDDNWEYKDDDNWEYKDDDNWEYKKIYKEKPKFEYKPYIPMPYTPNYANDKLKEKPKNINFPHPIGNTHHDADDIKRIMGYVLKEIYPFVISVLNSYDYENSPIYDAEVDKDIIKLITEKSTSLAISSLSKINLTDSYGYGMGDNKYWTLHDLLYSAVEGLVIFHIFNVLRPKSKNKKMPDYPQPGFEFSTFYY